jgi:signal recognition particle receptor subunit beta
MVFFNYSTMQMAAKVVYYGPGLCGKTTNLHWIYSKTATDSRGEMVSLETETDRTLFFDLLPLDVGQIAGFNTRVQLYTVPGQVFYNTTRKLVLKGVDGVVFVADSQRPMLGANVESFKNLEENLAEMGLVVDEMPLVLQFNKRDLADVCSVDELNEALNRKGWPHFEATAIHGRGVFETLKGITRSTLMSLRQRLTQGERKPAAARPDPGTTAAPPPAPAPAATPAAAKPVAPAPQPARLKPPPAAGPIVSADEMPERQVRRTVDVEKELSRLRKEALRSRSGTTPARPARPARENTGTGTGPGAGSATTNGKRELSRDIKLTLKRQDFQRARKFSLSFQVEDENDEVVDSVKGLSVDLGSPADVAKVLLKLNIALQAKE